MTIYKCPKCGNETEVYIPLLSIHCGCGGRMQQQEQQEKRKPAKKEPVKEIEENLPVGFEQINLFA